MDDAVYRAWLAEQRRPVDVNLEFTPEQRALFCLIEARRHGLAD
jgi:hypothetical protein